MWYNALSALITSMCLNELFMYLFGCLKGVVNLCICMGTHSQYLLLNHLMAFDANWMITHCPDYVFRLLSQTL